MNPFLIGFLGIGMALIEAMNSKRGHEAWRNIIEGFKTSKEDLEVNWEVLERANKKEVSK